MLLYGQRALGSLIEEHGTSGQRLIPGRMGWASPVGQAFIDWTTFMPPVIVRCKACMRYYVNV